MNRADHHSWIDPLQSTPLRPNERPPVTGQTASPENASPRTASGQNGRRVVVAGGGPAAHRFAEAMHARGLDGWQVTVLTEEAHLPCTGLAPTVPLPRPAGHPRLATPSRRPKGPGSASAAQLSAALTPRQK